MAPWAVALLLALVVLEGCGPPRVRRVPATRQEGGGAAAPSPVTAAEEAPTAARTRLPPVNARGGPESDSARRRRPGGPVDLPTIPTPNDERVEGPFTYETLRDGSFGGILHGVGPMWTPTEPADYRLAFPDTRPALQRMGIDLRTSPRFDDETVLTNLGQWLALFPKAIPCLTIKFDEPIGKGLGRGLEQELLNGDFDAKLVRIAHMLRDLDRPSFARIGPEVNAPWNGYEPEPFVEAFRHVVRLFRREGADRTVFVFNVKAVPDVDEPRDMTLWDPGDEWADWWSVDLFRDDVFDASVTAKVDAFLAEAARRGKPVMIPESCPAGMDMGDLRTWRDWFVPYLAWINGPSPVKAFLYSNRDFGNKDQNLSSWRDMRIDGTALADLWRRELAGPQYVHEHHLSPP